MSFLISSVRRQLIVAFMAVSLVFMGASVLAWAVALAAVLVAAVISLSISRDFSRRITLLLDGIRSLDADALAELEHGLEAIARGDLTREVRPPIEEIPTGREDEVGELTRTFNGMVEKTQSSIAAYNTTRAKVAGMLRDISSTSEQLSLSSQQMANTSEEAGRAVGEIAQAVVSVAAGAEDQVRSIAEAKILTDEVALASQASANGAQQTAGAAAEARDLAEQGAQAVSSATEAMQAIRDSSAWNSLCACSDRARASSTAFVSRPISSSPALTPRSPP